MFVFSQMWNFHLCVVVAVVVVDGAEFGHGLWPMAV